LFAESVEKDMLRGRRPEFERIFLANFLHIGLQHLAMNMYFLVSIGGIIESMWGRWRFLTIYLVSALVSGCVVLTSDFLMERNALTAGASGAMFGIFASLLVWFGLNH